MNYSLNPIGDSPLGKEQARHLLNRSLFAYRRSELEQFAAISASDALDLLLSEGTPPDPPLQVFKEDPDIAFGETWVDAPLNSDVRFVRKKSLRSWWISQLLNQQTSLREKMVLFWHNHFVTEVSIAKIPAFLYQYNTLIRKHAFGNFKTLAEEMTINTAMLRYLDGIQNKAGSPNENYARELFELFTIGKGPMISEGDYTYYTENDVQEGARVLTGWRISNDNLASYFSDSKHDKEIKKFSHHFANLEISDQGESEYLALIDMIFSKRQTAKALVIKLYRWFVYYRIDEEVMAQIIEPLTDTFFNNGFDIVPVLRQLLASEHFYDASLRGCYIKNPLEFIIGSMRRLEVDIPGDLTQSYEHWNLMYQLSANQDQDLGEPPDVAGWPAYYLAPQFNELWINSATLPQKAEHTTKLLNEGYKKNGHTLKPDFIKLAEMTSLPSDPNTLISEMCDLLLPVPVSEEQISSLKEVLIPGLPDFEWTVEWNDYVANPSDTNLKDAIENALRQTIEAIMHMPEYYLM